MIILVPRLFTHWSGFKGWFNILPGVDTVLTLPVVSTIFLLLGVIAAPLILCPVDAVGSDHDRTVAELSDTLMSPYCPGVTISACASDDARKLRAEIRTWLESGMLRAEVEQNLVKTYGPGILGKPGSRGFDLMGWTAPGIFVLLLALLLLKMVGFGSRGDNVRDVPINSDGVSDTNFGSDTVGSNTVLSRVGGGKGGGSKIDKIERAVGKEELVAKIEAEVKRRVFQQEK